MGDEKKTSTSVSFEECLRRVFNGDYECRHKPEDPIEPGEIVLGTLENTTARNIYSLWHEMIEGASKFSESLPKTLPKEEKKEIRRIRCQFQKMTNRISCAKTIFWELVYSDFPESREAEVAVGIRKDWQVVIFKSESLSSFADLFRENG